MRDGTGRESDGLTDEDWAEMGVTREEFYRMIDSSPEVERLGERLERVRRRFRQVRESGGADDELEEIRAEVREIGGRLEALGVVPPPDSPAR
ncbi:MAG: hypothetical protein ABEJ46_01860 [Gemmatimonadota bacterium]